jgi:tetratricopeptide (TPR) repeat protein
VQYRHQAFLIFHERWEELILSINADQLLATRAVAIQLKRQRRYNDAIALMNQVLDNARTVFGEKSFNYAMMISQVADINRLKGDLLAAEQAYRQTVEIFKATVDPNHPLLGEALNGLGLVLRSANRLTEAEQYLTQGTDIFKNAYGENSPYYVFALNNMAELYAIQGRHEQAIATYEQLLAIQRQFPRHVTDYFGDRLCRLGALYYELAQYPKAIQILQEASQVALQLYGEDNMNYATTLSDLALQYKMLGDWDQA